jgi:hypothetical protein
MPSSKGKCYVGILFKRDGQDYDYEILMEFGNFFDHESMIKRSENNK